MRQEHTYLPPDLVKDNRIRQVNLKRVIDGDTIDFEIDQGFSQGFSERVRLYRVNTPERRGTEAQAGKWVHQKVIDWFEDSDNFSIHSINWNRGVYGRLIADVYNGRGECLNAWLLLNCYAWPTDENGSLIGLRDINRLKLPTGIINQVTLNQRD